ncbi:MAG: PilZ domain-containing protein [Cellvibrionaceae bacterium]|nr:PilZ domain-containing protein [Cellvibrionaceae bacterium]
MFSLSFRTEKSFPPSATRATGKAHWQDWEAALWAEAALSNQVIQGFIPATGLKVQTVIHAFDLQNSEILLDGLYPMPLPNIDLESAHSPINIWLQIKAGDVLYLLFVEIKHIAGQFITARVLDTGITRNRRWEDRIYFPRLSAPRVELHVGDMYLANAQLSNLSLGGAQIIIFGPLAKKVLHKQRELRCNIHFNNELNILMQGAILQRQSFKVPCLHSILRIKFHYSGEQQRTHLNSLLFAYQSANTQRVA